MISGCAQCGKVLGYPNTSVFLLKTFNGIESAAQKQGLVDAIIQGADPELTACFCNDSWNNPGPLDLDKVRYHLQQLLARKRSKAETMQSKRRKKWDDEDSEGESEGESEGDSEDDIEDDIEDDDVPGDDGELDIDIEPDDIEDPPTEEYFSDGD